MGQYSLQDFDTWYHASNSEINIIYEQEGGTSAYPKLANRTTNSGGTGVYIVDSFDNTTIKEFYFVMASDEEISKSKNLVAEEHLAIVQKEKHSYPCYELVIQVDANGKIIDYTKRKLS